VFRALHAGKSVLVHPDSGEPLLGLLVPSFDRVLELAAAAAHCVPLGYLGVDIAIDADGAPLVLEINARPGLEIQNVNGCGLRPALAALREEHGA
jgi:Sugar-transfer associated ATP-grasp